MIFYLVFVVLLLVGLPIVFSMGFAGVVFFTLYDIPLNAIPQRILGGIDSFTLLAIPLYVMAGEIMETGGISRRLIKLAGALVGHIRGGLGHVVVVATMFFSGISGSASADTAAIGSLMIPSMAGKYSPEKATAIVASAGALGCLIPPSINLIILAGVANLSVSTLFFAGILPAVVTAFCLMLLIYYEARKRNIPMEERPTFKQALSAVGDAFLALLTPIIILGGIVFGIFTATEAAVVAVVYATLISMYVYREITWRDIIPIILRSTKITGAVMFLIGVASLFAWVTAREQIPAMIMNMITSISTGPWVFLMLVSFVFLILGSVLEGAPAIIIFVPIVMPVALKLGIDPIHFGIAMIATLGLGFILPPLGLCLLIACSIAKISVVQTIKPMFPYLLIKFVAVMIITYVSWFTLFIPKLMGYVPMGRF